MEYPKDYINKIICGDCLKIMRDMPDGCVDCVVTSPPYYGLRDYGVDGQIGLEPAIQVYIGRLVEVFGECKRVLKKTGTMWINIGDSYAGSGKGAGEKKDYKEAYVPDIAPYQEKEIPPKSLCQIPERLSIALTDELGLIKRNTVIWYKRNCMPSSVSDRFTVDFEYLYFYVKSKVANSGIHKWIEPPMRPVDASWLAAMIDAEGTIGIRKSRTDRPHPSYGAMVNISNTNINLLRKCVDITGLGKINKHSHKTNFDVFRWEVTHRKAIAVLAEVYPYLIAKKEQAKVVIALQANNKYRGNQYYNELTNAEYKEKDNYYLLVKQLNQKQIELSGLPDPNLNRYSGCEDYWFEQQFEDLAYSTAMDPRMNGGFTTNRPERGYVGASQQGSGLLKPNPQGRNKRTVWDIPTESSGDAHFAVFPRALVYTPIKAGCPPNGIVLDPFAGSGTTCLEAKEQGKNYIGIELNPEYLKISESRLRQEVLFQAKEARL